MTPGHVRCLLLHLSPMDIGLAHMITKLAAVCSLLPSPDRHRAAPSHELCCSSGANCVPHLSKLLETDVAGL